MYKKYGFIYLRDIDISFADVLMELYLTKGIEFEVHGDHQVLHYYNLK